jgi:protease PrsW
MLETYLPFLMALFPGLFLIRYFYLKDIRKPEPIGLIVKIFIFGILSTIPVLIMEMCLMAVSSPLMHINTLIFHFIQAFIVAGFCEEYIKMIVVKKFIYNNEHFDEVMDGVVYTIVASIGFACMENIMYVISGGYSVAILRAFTAVPLHAFASGIMGYYIGKAKFSDSPQNEKLIFKKGLMIAISIHGLYNFLLFLTPNHGWLFGFMIFPLLFYSYKLLKRNINNALSEDTIMNR